MATCFVIQPFDSGKFDKRFDDVYKPAIEAADLEAYRVDRDRHVEVTIDAIEEGIQSAAICLADITTNNPNVWYELGFAFASGRHVVMTCSEERTESTFPFDIQHRPIIKYKSEAPRDFESLRHEITGRLKALLTKGAQLRQIAEAEQVAPTKGLSQAEILILAALAGSALPSKGTGVWGLKQECEKAGLTSVGFALGYRRLLSKRLIEEYQEQDNDSFNREEYDAVQLTAGGWQWIDENESLFVLKKPAAKGSPHVVTESFDDDIPF